MATEKNLVEFRKSYPIDFKLLDQDEQAVLYISEDKDDWKLHLTIANTSSQAITMVHGQGGVSSDNHHFALLFRPGTLSKRTLDLLGSDDYTRVSRTADWKIARIVQPGSNETESNKPVTLFLLYQGANKTLAVGETRTIEFSGISAAPGSGSRGTQVELVPHQLHFASDNTPITASRTQYMHVTNHSGRKNIPLHVAVVDGNRLLNGATDATITLRITNVFKPQGATKSAITFRKKDAKEPTKLTVSYDKGDDNWMLATSKASVVASYTNEAGEKRTVYGRDPVGAQGESPDQEITFDDDFSLEYGRSIDITVENLVVSSTAGQANVYLHYENIPGYWDGQFVCSVEKGPIVVKDGNVGIGMANPGAAKLAVDGKLAVNGSLTVTGPSDLLGTPVLKVEGWTHLQVDKEQFLFLRDIPKVYDAQGGIHLFTSKSKLLVAQNFDQKGQPVPLPEINLVADKVGIGTTAPSAKLEIGGDVKMSFGPGAEGLHFRRNINGNPGIFVTGTYGANAGLTIAKVDKGDKGDTYGGNIPKIMLNTDELVVTGSLKVNTIEAKDSGPLIIKGAQQFVGSRRLWHKDKDNEYGKDWENIDVPIYSLGGPPVQTGATRHCRFYIIAWDNWNPENANSGHGTIVRLTLHDNRTFDVVIPAIWGEAVYHNRQGQSYSDFYKLDDTWIDKVAVRNLTGKDSSKAKLFELWVEFWDFFE